jgi:putative flippase GtrA
MKIPLFMQQMMRYAGVGGVSAIFHYGTLIAAVELGGSAPVSAAVLASSVGAVVNYLLNYHFTFGSRREHRISVIRFSVVALLGTGLNAALMALGVEVLGLHYLLVQIGATVVVFFSNFLLNRAWTFGGVR